MRFIADTRALYINISFKRKANTEKYDFDPIPITRNYFLQSIHRDEVESRYGAFKFYMPSLN